MMRSPFSQLYTTHFASHGYHAPRTPLVLLSTVSSSVLGFFEPGHFIDSTLFRGQGGNINGSILNIYRL